MERPRVLLAAHEDADAIAHALARAGFEVVGSEDAFEALLAAGDTPQMAILDADLSPTIIRRVHHRLSEIGPVPSLILLGDEAGELDDVWQVSDEFVVKPVLPDALVYRLQALIIRSGAVANPSAAATPNTSPSAVSETEDDVPSPVMIGAHDPSQARVIAIFAPKGGVGKTTVAVNLAVALRTKSTPTSREALAALELAKRDDCICTPHNAFNSLEAVDRKSEHSVKQILAFLETGQFLWPVVPG